MATTTGLYGGTRITQQTGLDQLRLWKKDQAQELLTELRSNLNNRTGVVRLLHTSKTEKQMTFKTAGGFKQIFLNGGKLQRSGEVIRDLLRQAGANEEQVRNFDEYVRSRGRSGVAVSRVIDEINLLSPQVHQAKQAPTEEGALAAFGLSFSKDNQIGQGAFGQVYGFQHDGQDMVYKQPSDQSSIWRLREPGFTLANQSKAPLIAQDRQSRRSDLTDADADILKNFDDSPFNVRDSQQSDSMDSYANGIGNHGFLPRNDHEREFSEISESDTNLIWKMLDRAKHFNQARSDSGVVVSRPKKNDPVNQAQLEDQSQHQLIVEQAEPAPSSSSGEALPRLGIAVSARVKTEQGIAPSVYVIKETLRDGTDIFHAVGGGSGLKAWWAQQQKGDSALLVVGLVMPKAAGVQPMVYPSSPYVGSSAKVQVDPADLKPMARSGLKALQDFSNHGFIHGDIKPENLIWDTQSKTLRVIDLDGMRKFSKKPGAEIPRDIGLLTEAYRHPLHQSGNAVVGVGQDLFAFGLTLLETATYAGGDSKKIADFSKLQKSLTGNVGRVNAIFEEHSIPDQLNQEIQNFPADSVQHFALQAIKIAIEYEFNRYDKQITSYDRWSPTDKSHPLNLLAKHPALNFN